MALFNLSSILFGDSSTFNKNSLLSKDHFGYNIYKYPIDIGSSDRGHYMVIHINAQKQTNEKFNYTGELPTVYANRTKFNTSPGLNYSGVGESLSNLADQFEITKSLKTGITDIAKSHDIDPSALLKEFSVSGTRTIRRTTQTIALYMPDSLNFNYSQKYSELSLGDSKFNLAAGIASGASDGVAGSGSIIEGIGKAGINIAPYLASQLAKDDFSKAMVTSVLGLTKNPMLEIIYSSPDFRRFNFDFFFHPRNENEAWNVHEIIRLLKYHQAPEILKSSNGFFLVPPSEFDIKFYYNENENPNIPRISTCILQDINIDYAPNGWAAYEVPGQPAAVGSTGTPVGIRITLSFMEAEYLTKDHFGDTGYGRDF